MLDIKNQEVLRIRDTFKQNTDRIDRLINEKYIEEPIIMTVTVFEVFLRDILKQFCNCWFYHEPHVPINALNIEEKVEYRKKIRKYLEEVGAYDEFLKNYYIYQSYPDPDITGVFVTLFGNQSRRINFQNLKHKNGARNAYKALFNIDLMLLLDQDRNKSEEKWKTLNELFQERHEIIHAGKTTSFSEEKLKDILSSLRYLEFNLLQKLLSCQ